MDKKKYTSIIAKYVKKNFESHQEAGDFFNCSRALVTLVLMNERAPNKAMLEATGHYRLKESFYFPVKKTKPIGEE